MLSRLDNEALRELLLVHGFEKMWIDFFTDLAVGSFELTKGFDFEQDFEKQIGRCRLDIKRHADLFKEVSVELMAIPPRVGSIRQNQEILEHLGDIGKLIDGQGYRELSARLSDLRLKKPGGRAAEDILLMKELIDRLAGEAELLNILAQTLSRQSVLKGTLKLLQEFKGLIQSRKRSSGMLTFQDVMEMSVRALLVNKPLRRFYKQRFRYIMIDEFQDNNQPQKDLLYLLAERKDLLGDEVPGPHELEADKLFFVGDEKQSIYRFRGADVSVFKHLRAELLGEGGQAIELNGNYRSEPGLVHFFNRLFPRVMEEGSKDYEAQFQELEPKLRQNEIEPQVIFFYKPPPGDDTVYSNEQSEAYALARYLDDAVRKKKLLIMDRGVKRPAEFTDITVLMRSTSNQIVYEQMFRHFNIPYSTQNVRSLFLEAPINDFYNLLQLTVYPEDRTAYAGLLRSPFVNISDSALIRLLLRDKESLKRGGRAAPFQGIEQLEIDQEDRKKLKLGLALYLQIQEWIDCRPISELVFHLWYNTGYRYYILQNPRYHNYLEYYDYFLKLAERADQNGVGLALFLDFIRENLGSYEKQDDLEILKPKVTGVQLMTIHKSKGLEFPIVVLADTGNRGRSSGQEKLYYHSSEFGLTLNLGFKNYFRLLGEEEIEKREIAEVKRLLYVALTRAQSHLIISGGHNRLNQSSPRSHLNMLFKGLDLTPESIPGGDNQAYEFKLRKIHDLTDEELLRTGKGSGKPELSKVMPHYLGAEEIGRRYKRRDFSVTELSGPLDRLKGKALELPPLPVDKILKAEELENNFGSLVHELISQRLLTRSDEGFEPDWPKLAIPLKHRQLCLESAQYLSSRFFASELGKLALGSDRLETELPFVYLWEGNDGPLYISGRIDLLFETDDRAYLIDFKTDRMYRPGEYMAQLGLYSLAARELTEGKISCWLFLLRSGERIPLQEEISWEEELGGLKIS